MNRLIDLIDNMELNELENLKKDVDSGNLSKLINQKTRVLRQKRGGGICPVCHADITNKEKFTLIFGGELKQKAAFCGSDCLEYFIYRLKKTETGERLGLENKSLNEDG